MDLSFIDAIEKGYEITTIIDNQKFCETLISSLGEILNSGGFGDVYSYLLNENIVIKRNKNKINREDLNCILGNNYTCINDTISEAIIGILLGFELGDDISTFTKTYGLFLCGDDHLYIVMEKVEGYTLNEIGEELTEEDKISIIYQITNALYQAQKKLRFNHNDLISNNILLIPNPNYIPNTYEDVSPEFSLNYRIPVGRYLVKLIDYGLSRATYHGRHISLRRVAMKYYSQSETRGQYVPYSSSRDFCKFMKNKYLQAATLDYSILDSCKYAGYTSIPDPITSKYPKFGPLDVFIKVFNQYRIWTD